MEDIDKRGINTFKALALLVAFITIVSLILAGFFLYVGTQSDNPSVQIDSSYVGDSNLRITVTSMANTDYVTIVTERNVTGGVDANGDGLVREIQQTGGSVVVTDIKDGDIIRVFATGNGQRKLVSKITVSR